MEAVAVDLAVAQEKWPMRPVPSAESRVKFPLNPMDPGPYIARIATKSIGQQGRQDDIRTIWLSH